MSDHNDNTYYECSDFIRYLYQEGVRKGAHINPSFYSEIIKFAKSPDGRNAYQKFISINPGKFGISSFKKITPKRMTHP
jgi:hypothetical protein